MTAAAAVAAGRLAAESLMVDSCAITRGVGARTLNRTSGTYEVSSGASVYTGMCRVKPAGMDQPLEAGERRVSLWPYLVSVPAIAVNIALDDTITITASALDPSLVDKQLRVRYVHEGSHLTSRRLWCEAVES